MVDAGLISVSVILPFILIAFNLLVMAKYIDPEAASGHWIAKLFILLGMLLAECTVLLLPLDVGNGTNAISGSGGISMTVLWQIAYVSIAVLVVVVMPFYIFYYEADDEGLEVAEKAETCLDGLKLRLMACKRNLMSACIYTCICMVLAIAGFLVLYNTIAKTEIPYRLMTVSVSSTGFLPVGTPYKTSVDTSACGSYICPCGVGSGCTPTSNTLSMDITIVVFMAVLMTFGGWFIFSIYTGIGLVALPMDAIQSYIQRPKMLSASDARNQKKALLNKAKDLIAMGDEMAERLYEAVENARGGGAKRKAQRAHKEELKRYRLLVDQLEKELEVWQMGDPASYRDHYNPLVPYLNLLFGIVGGIISIVWILHIIIYMLFNPPIYAFLNKYLAQLDSFFSLFSTLTIAVMSMYLLLAASKGAAKFGTRFFLVSVHPLEPGKTLLNSFIFNVQLVLLCVLPTVQFSTNAFNAYAVYTSAGIIFGNQMNYTKGLKVFYQYNIFLFMLLSFVLLSIIYFVSAKDAIPFQPERAHPPLFSHFHLTHPPPHFHA